MALKAWASTTFAMPCLAGRCDILRLTSVAPSVATGALAAIEWIQIEVSEHFRVHFGVLYGVLFGVLTLVLRLVVPVLGWRVIDAG